MGTWIVGAIVLILVGAAISVIYRDKKNGKGRCGGDCGKCSGCH